MSENSTVGANAEAWMDTPIVDAEDLNVFRGRNPASFSRLLNLLDRLDIHTLRDLFFFRPYRYEDRREIHPIASLSKGEAVLVQGTIEDVGVRRFSRKFMTQAILSDGTGRIRVQWWNQSWPREIFVVGRSVLLFGKITGVNPPAMSAPEFEIFSSKDELRMNVGRIVPVYHLTEGLAQKTLRSVIMRLLERYLRRIPIGREYGQELGFPSRQTAFQMIHAPTLPGEEELGRKRLAMDELYDFQLDIQRRKRNLETARGGIVCPGDNHLIRPFLKALPFTLTDAQTAVLREIRGDFRRGIPMRRLLQGDVGCGKTVVAACAALMVIEGGYNVVIMAPTEILAIQHYRNFSGWFEPLGVSVRLWTGREKQKEYSLPLREHQGGIVIGTHALIEDRFSIDRLGLVVIDEQHKFGVDQRERMLKKGNKPHLLVMSATPIPRTLALTLYGELEVSLIKHSPSGRGSVRTFIRRRDRLSAVWDFVRTKLEEKRQVYVVCPVIDECSDPELRAVEAEFRTIRKELEGFSVGLLHGRMKGDEKEYIMKQFAGGLVHVLVCTSVVEVGVDVPNATVMVIESAERFGLAQLHQLRGRVGRGKEDSFCALVVGDCDDASVERLSILEESRDGFRIAEEDLRQRGPGDFLGERQHGLPPFHFADLCQDFALIQIARQLVAGDALFAGDAQG